MSCNLTAPIASCPTEGCYLSEATGQGITFGLLIVFTLMGAFAVPLIKKQFGTMSADFWYSARDSQPAASIALSICATSAGAWLLYTPGEAAVLAGWWGVMGYTIAIFLGPMVMCLLASKVRQQCPESANITDWVGQRYGRCAQIFVCIVLLYYMFIYLTSQLKTMGDMTVKFYGKSPEWGIIPVALFTMTYTIAGGLPASIMTDWVQAVAILICVLILAFTIFSQVHFSAEDWEQVSHGTDAGWDAFVSLCISVFGAEVFNLAFWQRIFAAKDDRQLKFGFLAGAGMVSFITFLFGVSGLLLKANDLRQNAACPPEGTPIYVPAFTFFEVLDMPDTTGFTRTLVFLVAVCTITSCADSFQTAVSSVISMELVRHKVETTKAMALGIGFVIIVNIPAMGFAIFAANDVNATFTGLAVKLTDLFGMADILTICLVIPLFSGLWDFSTRLGCITGMASGILYILVWGWIEMGTYVGGFANLTMMCFGVDVKPEGYSPYACGPWYAWRSAMLYTTIPIVTGVVTYTVSWMEHVYTKLSIISEKMTTTEGV